MRTSSARKRPSAPVPKPRSDDLQLLLQDLIDHVACDKAAEVPANTTAKDVMLDMQMDGVRCVLTRVPTQPGRPTVALSPREREIARMVSAGYPNKTIAGVLDISSWTVSTYLRRIFAKLNVNTRAAMVARLMADGLLKN